MRVREAYSTAETLLVNTSLQPFLLPGDASTRSTPATSAEVVTSGVFYCAAPCCQLLLQPERRDNLLIKKSFYKTAPLSKTRIIGRSGLPSSFFQAHACKLLLARLTHMLGAQHKDKIAIYSRPINLYRAGIQQVTRSRGILGQAGTIQYR
ncbi:hypothetical protein SAMN05216210_0155 [Halopseudomonas salegens]|uniref:Uncharacterized protein n=1 Tax=Halopseudomonas salegens TaxID=1434072 RepID=A0A1H2DZX1_9GAMM|nr:hypothetical protein SAMN05216210_0155 [Halopseudomonas salegens]